MCWRPNDAIKVSAPGRNARNSPCSLTSNGARRLVENLTRSVTSTWKPSAVWALIRTPCRGASAERWISFGWAVSDKTLPVCSSRREGALIDFASRLSDFKSEETNLGTLGGRLWKDGAAPNSIVFVAGVNFASNSLSLFQTWTTPSWLPAKIVFASGVVAMHNTVSFASPIFFSSPPLELCSPVCALRLV